MKKNEMKREEVTLESKIMQLVKMKYDLQKLRIATGNRICASFDQSGNQDPCASSLQGW